MLKKPTCILYVGGRESGEVRAGKTHEVEGVAGDSVCREKS